jgi:glycosyltransferase involved in cell wall biosynthesis
MRILWHSAAPWLPTGYATQTAAWTQYLRGQGHDVAISSYFGNPGQPQTWKGMKVYPCPTDGRVDALMIGHAKKHKADVLIVLADVWLMNPHAFRDIPTIVWVPIDCDPLSLGDTAFLTAGVESVLPVAMAEHGQKMLAKAGIEARVIPHGIDTATYVPEHDRDALRAAFGIGPQTFAIGMNFNNIDPYRKAAAEQLMAFRNFHRKHPDSVMFCHTIMTMKGSVDLRVLIKSLGVEDCVRVSDQYRILAEGFGLPAIEAQACGTPVILAENTTGPQLVGPGWLVHCEPFWNHVHGSWWQRPGIRDIEKAYEKAWADKSPFKRDACRTFAKKYDLKKIGPMWDELLEGIK